MPAMGVAMSIEPGGSGTSRAGATYEALRGEILSLALPPGALLAIPETCARLGISRTTLATAVRRLASEGLVVVAPQAGTTVARFSLAAIEESAFLREAIEVAAVRRVAEAPPPGLVDALHGSLRVQDALLAEGDGGRLYAEDEAFHETLMAATGFGGVVDAAARAALAVKRARLILMPDPGRAADTVAEHRAIAGSIESADPEAAAAAMRHHLRRMLTRLGAITRQRPELFEEDDHARR